MVNVALLEKANELNELIPRSSSQEFMGAMDKDQVWLIQRAYLRFIEFGGNLVVAYDGKEGTEDVELLAFGNFFTVNDQLYPDDGTNGMLILDDLVGIGRGGGSAVIEELIDIADDENRSFVLESLEGSTSFYERFDFEHIGFSKPSGHDKLNMYYYPDGKPEALREEEMATASFNRKTYIRDKSVAQAALMAIAEHITNR